MRKFEINKMSERRVFTVTQGRLPGWPWTCTCRVFGCEHVEVAKVSLRTAVSRTGLDHPAGAKIRIGTVEYRVRYESEKVTEG